MPESVTDPTEHEYWPDHLTMTDAYDIIEDSDSVHEVASKMRVSRERAKYVINQLYDGDNWNVTMLNKGNGTYR